MAVRVGQGPGSGSLTDAAAFGLPQGQRKREAGPAPHLQAGGPGFPRPLPAAPHERSGGGPRGDTSKRPQPSSETGQTHRNGGTQAGRTEPVSLTAKRRAIKATGGAGALTRFFCVKPEGQATSSGSFHGCLRHGHECVGPQGAGGPYSTPFAQRGPWHSPSPSGVPHSGDNGTATLQTGPGHQGHRRRRRVLSPPPRTRADSTAEARLGGRCTTVSPLHCAGASGPTAVGVSPQPRDAGPRRGQEGRGSSAAAPSGARHPHFANASRSVPGVRSHRHVPPSGLQVDERAETLLGGCVLRRPPRAGRTDSGAPRPRPPPALPTPARAAAGPPGWHGRRLRPLHRAT